MRSLFSKSYFICSCILSLLFGPALGETVKPDVHIGIYAPFSNEHAVIGRTILGTIEKAKDQLDVQNINYTFYTLDELPNNPNAAKTLQKFIEAHQIQVLLTNGRSNGLLAAPIAKKNNIIHFSMADDPKIADGKNTFLAWNLDYDQTMVLVDNLKQQNEKRTVNKPINPHSKAVINHSMLKQLQSNSPVTNAFQLVHQSAVLALKSNADCSGKYLSKQIHVLALAQGIEGAFNVGKASGQVAEKSIPTFIVEKTSLG